MSSCHGIVHQEVRPLTTGVMVAKISGPGNPAPVPPCDSYESDIELLYLSQKKLVGFLDLLYRVTSLIFLVHLAITYHYIHCSLKILLRQTHLNK